jgi:dynein heavy chain
MKEVTAIIGDVVKFAERFEKEGLGNPETPMDQELQLVLTHKQEHKELCARRDELHIAEKLFGILLTSFSQLMSIATSLGSCQQIYQLYDDQERTMNEWSSMLWSEVDLNVLSVETDGFELASWKLPHELRGLPPYEYIKKNLGTFKESLPG